MTTTAPPALAARAPEQAPRPAPRPAPGPALQVDAAPVRVVVVDDVPDLRELITLVLGRRGAGRWSVVGSAGDGIAAVEVVAEQAPDVVLLDIAMPIMDGLQALPLVRRACPQALVVMLSAFPSSSARASALAQGAHAYLEKDDLVATLVPKLTRLVQAGAGGENAGLG